MNNTVIEDLSHTFSNKDGSLKVIDLFSLIVNEGETVAILGPSGCGKSTILRCISGLLNPTDGIVTISGKSSAFALKEKMIGFAFQEAALLDWATVKENIMLPGNIGKETIPTQEVQEKTNGLMGLMGLLGFEAFYPPQLSGGMKQRVALARALLLEPTLLLLDEPFGSLDLLTRSNLIVEFSKILTKIKIATIIVTHSIEEAVFLADKILILSPRPCSVIEEVSPYLGSQKDFDLFEREDFLHNVAKCRRLLLEHWSGDEK